jgi:hypothetical protein
MAAGPVQLRPLANVCQWTPGEAWPLRGQRGRPWSDQIRARLFMAARAGVAVGLINHNEQRSVRLEGRGGGGPPTQVRSQALSAAGPACPVQDCSWPSSHRFGEINEKFGVLTGVARSDGSRVSGTHSQAVSPGLAGWQEANATMAARNAATAAYLVTRAMAPPSGAPAEGCAHLL